MSKKYLIFIPDLVSIEFDKNEDRATFFRAQYELYGTTPMKLKFHFTINSNVIDDFFNRIHHETIYRTYNSGISKNKMFWYSRKAPFIASNFAYDGLNKSFYFRENIFYRNIFSKIRVGEFFYSKDIIREIINLTLFINGYISLHGMGIELSNGNVFLAAVPRDNGKTTFILSLLNKNSNDNKYLSDNTILINISARKCYPTAPSWSLGKKNSFDVFNILLKNKSLICRKSLSFKKIYFLIDSKKNNFPLPKLEDFFIGLSSAGYINLLIRDYIMLNSMGRIVLDRMEKNIESLRKMNKFNEIEILGIENFKYSDIINEKV